jgi:NAD(P)-dependent dehydrogenase (short-subunit alcohol dehydrogenase family)
MATAIVTGASKGLGRALAKELVARGWSVVVDARGSEALSRVEKELELAARDTTSAVVAVRGDVSDPAHRAQLVRSAAVLGGLELVVNNASTLGPTPMPRLSSSRTEDLREVFETNTFSPIALVAESLPLLLESADPRVMNVTSDASVEAYEGWGVYGSSKAALDHLSAVMAVEESGLRVWSVDPGDMNTEMHREASQGEDVSGLPAPEEVVGRLIALIEGEYPSGRYRAEDISTTEARTVAATQRDSAR